MAEDPAFLVYYKDILVSCAHWDADILGWYFRLLSHQADKQGGLPDDLESLASLAGVKFSQFDRFNECWKRTLKAKFETNAEGLLYNLKQDNLLTGRRNYKVKQAKRGLVGSFMKKAKNLNRFTPHQLGLISEHLFLVIDPEYSKADNEGAYKRTVDAYIGIVNGNTSTVLNSLEGAGNLSAETELPAATLEAAEMSQFTMTQNKNTEFIKGHWKIFLTERLNDPPNKRMMFQTLPDYTSYFLNWIRTKHPNKHATGTTSTASGNRKAAGANEVAANLAAKLAARGAANPSC